MAEAEELVHVGTSVRFAWSYVYTTVLTKGSLVVDITHCAAINSN